MSVSDGYLTWVLEQIGRVVPVTHRKMFGGVGLYSDGYFFALLDDDRLYLKVDDSNRAAFEAIGSSAFQPFKDQPGTMNYWELPGDYLEQPDRAREWLDGSLEVARTATRKKRRKKK